MDERPEERQIIDLQGVESEEGEIKFTHTHQAPQKSSQPFGGLVKSVLGIALGVAIFLLLITFFVYVIIPLIAILILWSLITGLLGRRKF